MIAFLQQNSPRHRHQGIIPRHIGRRSRSTKRPSCRRRCGGLPAGGYYIVPGWFVCYSDTPRSTGGDVGRRSARERSPPNEPHRPRCQVDTPPANQVKPYYPGVSHHLRHELPTNCQELVMLRSRTHRTWPTRSGPASQRVSHAKH